MVNQPQPAWLDILPRVGTVGILGRHQYGKSALAYHIAEERHRALGSDAVVLGPPLTLKDKFPEWVHLVDGLQELRLYPNHTVILDESSWPLHARQSLHRDHVGFDKAMSVAGQLGQLFIFCTHHSRKLDPNVVTEYEVLAWKLPKRMHVLMERPDIRQWAQEARAALMSYPIENRKKYTYVLYDDLEESAVLENPLPTFWSEDIRTAAAKSLLEDMAAVDVGTELLDAVRGLAQASLDIWDEQPDLRERLIDAREQLNTVWKGEATFNEDTKARALEAISPALSCPGPAGQRVAKIYQRLAVLTVAPAAVITIPKPKLSGG